MFLIEGFLKERKRKIHEWERGRREWLNENSNRSASSYHYVEAYPVRTFENAGQYIGGGVMCAILFFMFFAMIASFIEEEKQTKNATAPGKNCRMFNREDTIRITSGDYKDTQGKIVGGCNKGDDYQIKLADGSFADITGDGEGRIMVGTRIVAIKSYKDLVVIEEPKNAKPESE